MNIRGIFTATVLFCLPWLCHAEQSQSFGDYTVHYSAFTTDVLNPAVARNYHIQRSKNRALLNVSVLKKVMGTTSKPVRATISGSAINLNQQLRDLDVRELTEDGAIYYIALVNVSNNETLKYTLHIIPEGETTPFTLSFDQAFVTQ